MSMTAPDDRREPVGFTEIRQQRAFEQVLQQIVDLMVSGELRPGDRLPAERQLSDMLGISRPSLREALRVLDAMGMIESRRGAGAASGTVIAERPGDSLSTLLRLHLALSHFSVDDFLEVRRTLEGSSVRRAATARTDEDLSALRALVSTMKRNKADREAFFAADAEFHVRIATIAGNQLATYLMQAIRDAMTVEMVQLSDAWGDWDDLAKIAVSDHERIVRALAKADADAAERAVREHLSRYDRPRGRVTKGRR